MNSSFIDSAFCMKRKSIKTIILLLFFSLFSLKTYAIDIHGKILDSITHEPLPYSTIQIVNRNNNIICIGTTIDSSANFLLKNISTEKELRLIVNFVGYRKKELLLPLKTQKNTVELGNIELIPNNNQLQEITVTADKKIKTQIDRTIYAVDSLMLSKSVATDDLLKKMPEITVNPITRKVSIKGKENTLVLINGINNGNSVDIRNIDPKDIDKVEIIFSPSTSTDVDFDGIINIKLKQIPRKGLSGDFDITAMPNGRYLDAYANLKRGTEKTRFSISYSNYIHNFTFHNDEIRKNILTANRYQTNGFCKNPFEQMHEIAASVDLICNKNNFFNISTQNNFSDVNKNIDIQYYKMNNGTLYENENYNQKFSSNYFIGNYTFYYKHNFSDKNDKILTTNLNLHYMNGNEEVKYQYENKDAYDNNENGKKKAANLKMEYLKIYTEKIKYDIGIQTFYQYFTGNLENNVQENDFHEIRYNAYTDIFMNFDLIDINLSLKAEKNATIFSNNSFNTINQQTFFPSVILSRKINNETRLKFEYKRTSFYPSAWMLAPYKVKIDSMNELIGNPQLRSSVRDNFEFTYSFRNTHSVINSSFYYYKINKGITDYKTYDSNSYCITTYDNRLNRMRTGMKINGSLLLFQFIEIEPNLNLFYESYNLNGNSRYNKSFISSSMFSIDLPMNLGIGSLFSYNGKLLSFQGYSKPYFSLDAVYIMKRFQNNLNFFVGIRDWVKSKEINYLYDNSTEQKDIFKASSYGILFRLTYTFDIGKKYKMEEIKTQYEMDKK